MNNRHKSMNNKNIKISKSDWIKIGEKFGYTVQKGKIANSEFHDDFEDLLETVHLLERSQYLLDSLRTKEVVEKECARNPRIIEIIKKIKNEVRWLKENVNAKPG
jgi:hypothetical protein